LKKVLQSYKSAWKFLFRHKYIVLVLYGFNLVLAILAIGPFKSYIKSVFDRSDAINTIAQQFDYSIIMDTINEYGIGIGMTLSALFGYFLLYVLWSTFATAGFLGLYQNTPSEGNSKMEIFWSSGFKYFFKFLRLNIYILIIYAILIGLMVLFFMKDGLDVFKMESEVFLIKRFWVLVVVFITSGFFISIFRDQARSNIIVSNSKFIYKENFEALKLTAKFNRILLSVINLLFLGLICVIYYTIKESGIHIIWLTFLLSQLYLILRLCHRVVRGCSFLEINQ